MTKICFDPIAENIRDSEINVTSISNVERTEKFFEWRNFTRNCYSKKWNKSMFPTSGIDVNDLFTKIRLALKVVKTCVESGSTPERVWLLGDSECTLASLEKTSGAFGEYFGNRVGDIYDNQARI